MDMEKFLTTNSIFFSRQTWLLLVLFFIVRIASFFLQPHLFIQGAIIVVLILLLCVLYFKNPDWAWYIVLSEAILDGAGHYLELGGISLRTLLIGSFLFLWLSHQLNQQILGKRLNISPALNYLMAFFAIIALFATGNGLVHGHMTKYIIADIMPFVFFLLLFPSTYLFEDLKAQEFLTRLLSVFVIGTAIFSLFAFTMFSTGISELQDPFYKWYRDVDAGKITDIGNGFFRVVEPGHLLVVPLILLITSLLMRDEKHNKMWRILRWFLILILVLNLSRGYFLALIVGLLILKYKHCWRKWLRESLAVILLIGVIFSGISLIASQGKTMGWEQFGIRVMSLTQPKIEISTATRMMKLPAILTVIKQHPILGVGVGSTFTFYNGMTYQPETTPHYDWGYLELWAELGLFGALAFIGLYVFTAYLLVKKIKNIPDWHDFDVGLLAGLIAFLIMNITIAALFHVFGIFFLIFALSIALKYTTIFDQTTTLLYRVFNRLKV